MLTRPTRWFAGWGHPHLSDESLIELHALLVSGEHAVAGRYLRHVRQCASCSERLETLRDGCGELRRDVLTAADARITPVRLDRQFDVIARRLDGHAGRVLPFPITVQRAASAPPLRSWLALAAACGLVIGIGAGRVLDSFQAGTVVARRPSASIGASSPSGRSAIQQETDEQMLVEIDAALTRSRTKEFRVLDELTPRILDVRARGAR